MQVELTPSELRTIYNALAMFSGKVGADDSVEAVWDKIDAALEHSAESFKVGDVVTVLNAIQFPHEVPLGTGRIVRISHSGDRPIYWIEGFVAGREESVLRLAVDKN